MNITGYFSEEDSNPTIYRGKMTLRSNYTIVDADESCYQYVGKYSALPLTGLAHPEDTDAVRDALERLKEGTQRVIFRMMCGNGSYRYMYAMLSLNGRVVDGEAYIDVELMDIMRVYYKFDSDHSKIGKYRKLMSLSDKMYFEYRYEEKTVTIFEYINDRGNLRFSDTMEHFQERVLESGEFNDKQKAEFETLLDCLKHHVEKMDVDMDGRIFGFDGGYLNLKGGIAYEDQSKKMMVAVVTTLGKVDLEEKYYMTRHAFDGATGVYNKRAINELAADLMVGSGDKTIFLCVTDIDDFKNINDTFGHLVGDQVIAKVAAVIKDVLAARGFVGRFGGDEFLIVTDKVKTEDELIMMLKTIRKHISWSCAELLGNVMDVTTSIGIARYPKDASNYGDLFKIADKCLYLAKAKGKNRFILYNEELHKDYNMETTSGKTSTGKSLDIYSRSCRAVVDILGNEGQDSRESFDESVKEMLSSYDIDRMGIFTGEKYERVYEAGNCEGFVEELTFLDDPKLVEEFDENGIYARNGILSLRESFPELYEQLEKQETKGFLVVKVELSDKRIVVVVYDVHDHPRKWSSNDKGLLYIAAQVLVRRYCALEK
ncbi:MAG: sensor domain-containing diguanylate cyclase [Acetatifactor sp.]|nr:sensor domain-containing diguanylate cyclase [Acetatifactor sp.]